MEHALATVGEDQVRQVLLEAAREWQAEHAAGSWLTPAVRADQLTARLQGLGGSHG